MCLSKLIEPRGGFLIAVPLETSRAMTACAREHYPHECPRYAYRLEKASRLDDANEQFCWPTLYEWATNYPSGLLLLEIAGEGNTCKRESADSRDGYCWCGKFKDGERARRDT